MLTDGRMLFRMLGEMMEGEVPAHLVEALVLLTLEDACSGCRDALQEGRRTAKERRLLRPLLEAWYEPRREHWALEQALRVHRDLLRTRYWDVRYDRVKNARTEFGLPALVALLLVDAQDRLQDDPAEAVRFARLAELASCRGPAALVSGCRLFATAGVANALRAGGRLAEASSCFMSARDLEPPDSRWIRAEVLNLQASLLKDQRRLPEARDLLRRSLRIFEAVEDSAAVARIHLSLSVVDRQEGNLDSAIAEIHNALRSFDSLEDPGLYLSTLHNLAFYHCEAGRSTTAKRLVKLLGPLYDRVPGRYMSLRRRWLEGLLAREEGEGSTETALTEVMEGFLEHSAFQAAVVALDLATFFLQEGRHADLADLAGRLPVVFERHGVHREALAAAILFREAAIRQRVTQHLLRRLRSYFECAEGKPTASFQPED